VVQTNNNTSPNPSEEGEQAVRKINLRKQLPLFWRGLGGGDSGLPRRSYLTARNDGSPTPALPKGEGVFPSFGGVRGGGKNHTESKKSKFRRNILKKSVIFAFR